ncbi:hypothetical protein B0H34DRAFT_479172 [Crassisporium funariophilum]|nr:hypothetical protein B0H34DRAFT_479172 [Crassisporium funariophilum]
MPSAPVAKKCNFKRKSSRVNSSFKNLPAGPQLPDDDQGNPASFRGSRDGADGVRFPAPEDHALGMYHMTGECVEYP